MLHASTFFVLISQAPLFLTTRLALSVRHNLSHLTKSCGMSIEDNQPSGWPILNNRIGGVVFLWSLELRLFLKRTAACGGALVTDGGLTHDSLGGLMSSYPRYLLKVRGSERFKDKLNELVSGEGRVWVVVEGGRRTEASFPGTTVHAKLSHLLPKNDGELSCSTHTLHNSESSPTGWVFEDRYGGWRRWG